MELQNQPQPNPDLILQNAARSLSKETNSAVIFYSGPIDGDGVDRLRSLLPAIRERRHERCYLILTTYGGDPAAGYRIARALQTSFQRISLFVVGFCKSAGTLIALGADELIMGERGELGPLDVQTTKRDDLLSNSSGLDIFKAIAVIQQQAFGTFEEYFLNIISHSGGAISAKTAADIASGLVSGIYSPMMNKIEPLGIGEMQRAINIATAYGTRLGLRNINSEQLDRLVMEYPSHGFVIDKREAEELFTTVRFPSTSESAIENVLNDFFNALSYHPCKTPLVCDLTNLAPAQKEENDDPAGNHHDAEDGQPGEPVGEADHPGDEKDDADRASAHQIDEPEGGEVLHMESR